VKQQRVVGIVGVGGIGGSIGMRARRDGALVVGYDRAAGALATALEVGAIDFAATREELYARAGTVVIAAYVDGTIAELEALKTDAPVRASLLIDVASVKAPVAAAGRGVARFVPTHPMAGTERSGVRAARPDLFEGRTWAYVPVGDPLLEARAKAFIGALGAVPLAIEADEHDRIVALTSHLPQLIASTYASLLADRQSPELEALTGATARELLRLGASGFAMWQEIFRANAGNVEPALRALGQALLRSADALQAGAIEDLAPIFRDS
jgi:prephenate dehydrogenase